MKATLDHIGIAVGDLSQALAFYRDALGLEVEPPEEVPSQRVRAHFVPVGEATIELLEPTSGDSPIAKFIEKRGPGVVTGADVQCGPDCEVVNRDLVICTLTTARSFEAELDVRNGRGYVTQEENAREENEIGVIPLDAVFSPVQRVRYRTEDTRVGIR